MLALGAALLYGLASVFQQASASKVDDAKTLRPGLLLALVHRPMWVLGIVCDFGGFALQALALSVGSLSLVQPLLVTGLVVALPLAARMSGTRMTRRDWFAATELLVGLIVFLVLATPSRGAFNMTGRSWFVFTVVTVILAAATVVLAPRHRGSTRAALLCSGAAIMYVYSGALTKYCGVVARHHPLSLATRWELYGLIGAACIGLLLNQSGFQAGPLVAALPPLTVIEPIGAVVVG